MNKFQFGADACSMLSLSLSPAHVTFKCCILRPNGCSKISNLNCILLSSTIWDVDAPPCHTSVSHYATATLYWNDKSWTLAPMRFDATATLPSLILAGRSILAFRARECTSRLFFAYHIVWSGGRVTISWCGTAHVSSACSRASLAATTTHHF